MTSSLKYGKRRPKVTRKRVNDPIVDDALRDVYNKLDKLQVTTEHAIASAEEDNLGDTTVVETEDGNTATATNTANGWMVDINSHYEPIANTSFSPSLGTTGQNRKPVRHESVKYDKNRLASIVGIDRTKVSLGVKANTLQMNTDKIRLGKDETKVLIKNEDGIVKIRNVDDSADGDIQCANIRDTHGKKLLEVDSASAAINHFKMSNSDTGADVILAAAGDDSNINVNIESKGTGAVRLNAKAEDALIQFLYEDALKFQLDASADTGSGLIREFKIFGTAFDVARLDIHAVTGVTRLWNVTDAGAGAHIQISAVDNLYLNAGGSSIFLNGGGESETTTFATGTTFGYFDLSVSSTCTLRSSLNYDLNFKSDLGSGDINLVPGSVGDVVIDKNSTQTATATVKGLHIDYDQTGISASGQTITGIGLDLDMNCESVTHVGTVNQTGVDIDMVANTDGTQTNTGIDVNVSGADINYGVKITTPGTHLWLVASADVNDYATLTVADTGDLKIATIGDGTTDSDLLLDVDGDIELNADGGTVEIKDASVPFVKFTAGRTDFQYDATNYARIAVDGSGITTISTIGGTPAAADFIVDAGGDIVLDSGTGLFIAKKAGTEFSVANSAYAGMILGYSGIGEDVVHSSYTLTTGYVVPNSAMTVRFIAPPSGVVEVFVQIYHNASTSNKSLFLGLSDNASYNTIGVQYEQVVRYPDETDDNLINHRWFITGLTPGNTYNYWLGAKTGGTNAFLNWGGDASGRYPDFIMKVTALPAATANFAVYD